MDDIPAEPQPEALTPREWQLFELLRRGFADHQIAQVLGIAEGDAGRHADRTLSKLGMSREQLSGQPAARPEPRPRSVPAPGPRFPSALKFAVGATALIVIAAILAIALALIIDSNDRATAPNGDDEVNGALHPLTGEDHWHAAYHVNICGEEQPPIPTTSGGIHTHGDGYIHMHPLIPEEEGDGARLIKFFEYAGGELTNDILRMPGSRTTHVNGSTCPDGRVAFLQVVVNGKPLDDVTNYIPSDGDDILISLNP